MAFVGGNFVEAEVVSARLRAAGIPVRTPYGAPWPPSIDPVWRGGFPVLVPAARVDEACEILGDTRSTARPLLPRALAILVLIVFVAPLLVNAIRSLTR